MTVLSQRRGVMWWLMLRVEEDYTEVSVDVAFEVGAFPGSPEAVQRFGAYH